MLNGQQRRTEFQSACVCVHVLSCFSRVWLFATLWTVVRQAPLSMEFSRQEYWSVFSCPPPGDLPNPGIEPVSPALTGRLFTTSTTWETPPTSIQHFKMSTGILDTWNLVKWYHGWRSLSIKLSAMMECHIPELVNRVDSKSRELLCTTTQEG